MGVCFPWTFISVSNEFAFSSCFCSWSHRPQILSPTLCCSVLSSTSVDSKLCSVIKFRGRKRSKGSEKWPNVTSTFTQELVFVRVQPVEFTLDYPKDKALLNNSRRNKFLFITPSIFVRWDSHLDLNSVWSTCILQVFLNFRLYFH